MWPAQADASMAEQRRLAADAPPAWLPSPGDLHIAGCFVCFGRHQQGSGAAGDPAWAAAAELRRCGAPRPPSPQALPRTCRGPAAPFLRRSG